jgi:hypothetical protein
VSLPRQIRSLLKLAAVLGVLCVALTVVCVHLLRQRLARTQELYDSVAVGDPWSGLEGFAERAVTSDPDSQVPPPRRYDRRTMFTSWEIVVNESGQVVGKYRYD